MVLLNLCRSLSRSSSTMNALNVWMNSRLFLANQASMHSPWLVKDNVRRNSSFPTGSHNKSDLSATNPGVRRLSLKERDHPSRQGGYGRCTPHPICAALLCSTPFTTYSYYRSYSEPVVIEKMSFTQFVTRLLKRRVVMHILVTDSIAFVRPIRSVDTLYMIDIKSPESFRDKLREAQEALEKPYVPVAVTYVSMNKEQEKAQIASWKKARTAS